MLVMLAQFCAILLFLWTPVSARILALVLQLYERNKLKLNYKRELYATLLLCSFQPHRHIKAIPVVTHTQGTKVCRYNWHSAGSLGRSFTMLKYKYIFQIKFM